MGWILKQSVKFYERYGFKQGSKRGLGYELRLAVPVQDIPVVPGFNKANFIVNKETWAPIVLAV
jgi:hypothetical protein